VSAPCARSGERVRPAKRGEGAVRIFVHLAAAQGVSDGLVMGGNGPTPFR
jgi:hypothetical protein